MSEPNDRGKNARKEVLTTFEASRYLNVAPKTVSNWIDAGHLKAYRTVGGHRRIRRQDLEAFISAQQSGRRPRTVPTHRRVLVVDDDPTAAAGLVQALREGEPPCEVEAAHSLFEAGCKMADFSPDVVVLDAGIAGARTADLLRHIQARPGSRQARVLVLTVQPQPELAEELLRQGAARCLPRPLDPAQLRREISQLLSQP
jgi:excisionase family DNA binding protein